MKRRPIKDIGQIAREFNLKLIILFGSRARGQATSDSDYDIGLYGKELLAEKEMIELTGLFAELLGTDRVDLVDLKRASPLLKMKAFEQFEVLYEEDPFLKYQLPLSSEAAYEECRDLYEMRRKRLEAFVNED